MGILGGGTLTEEKRKGEGRRNCVMEGKQEASDRM